MTSRNETNLRIRHAPTARLLACVLLALVTYTTTSEVVHRHGNLLLNRAAETVTTVSTQGGGNSSLNDPRSLADCLICQLHQNLATTLFSPQAQIVAPVTEGALTPAAEVSYPSHTATPRRGRAPPLTSLS